MELNDGISAKPPASLSKGSQLPPSDLSITWYDPSQLNDHSAALSEERQMDHSSASKAMQLNQTKGNNTEFNKVTALTLANDVHYLKLETNVARKKANSVDDSKPGKAILHEQEQGKKDQLNLAIVRETLD